MAGKSAIWQRRQVLYLISGAIGGLALHGCGQTESPTASAPASSTEPSAASSTASSPVSTSASVGIVTWIGYTPFYIAQEKEFFKEFGLNLEVQVFGSGTDASAAFAAGQTDGLSLVPSEAVLLAARGKDFRVVYVVDTSNGGDGILVRNSIGSIADLRGKQIAVEKGGVSHFFLLQVLADAGLQESDVTLVSLTPDAAAAAYQSGRIDVAVTYAPFLFTANAGQTDGRILYDSSQLKIPTALADLFIFDTSFVEQNPGAIEAFIRGNAKGLEFLQTDREEGLEIAAKQLGLTPADLEEQLKGVKLADLDSNLEMLNVPDSNLYVLTPLNQVADFLKNQGQIDQIPDLSNALEPKFVLTIQDAL